MTTDVKLNQVDETFIVLESRVLKAEASDFLLDHAARRKSGSPAKGNRRALVHDAGDGLTVNYAADYPGGVTINGCSDITPNLRGQGHATVSSPVLAVHGGLSYEVQSITKVGYKNTSITVNVGDEISSLNARVAALEAAAKH